MTGKILKGIGGLYHVMDEEGKVHALRAQGKIRRERMKPLAGDEVEIQPGVGEEDGWILSILPRKNVMVRPPVANIDAVLIIAAAASPDPDLAMIDRLIFNARHAGITPILAVSKRDLDPDMADEIVRQYRSAEVEVRAVCVRTGEGIDDLRKLLKGRVHALAGQSGAGKSTLINALYGLELETGEISYKIKRGKNTTRSCELIPVEGGGMVLDTPGFSLLEAGLFDPVELQNSYPEFEPYMGECYFQPCYHATEPRCAVRDAVAEDTIESQRHGRYVELLEEMKQRWRERYD